MYPTATCFVKNSTSKTNTNINRIFKATFYVYIEMCRISKHNYINTEKRLLLILTHNKVA